MTVMRLSIHICSPMPPMNRYTKNSAIDPSFAATQAIRNDEIATITGPASSSGRRPMRSIRYPVGSGATTVPAW